MIMGYPCHKYGAGSKIWLSVGSSPSSKHPCQQLIQVTFLDRRRMVILHNETVVLLLATSAEISRKGK